MDKDSVQAINGVPQAQVLDEVKGLNYLSNHSETNTVEFRLESKFGSTSDMHFLKKQLKDKISTHNLMAFPKWNEKGKLSCDLDKH